MSDLNCTQAQQAFLNTLTEGFNVATFAVHTEIRNSTSSNLTLAAINAAFSDHTRKFRLFKKILDEVSQGLFQEMTKRLNGTLFAATTATTATSATTTTTATTDTTATTVATPSKISYIHNPFQLVIEGAAKVGIDVPQPTNGNNGLYTPWFMNFTTLVLFFLVIEVLIWTVGGYLICRCKKTSIRLEELEVLDMEEGCYRDEKAPFLRRIRHSE